MEYSVLIVEPDNDITALLTDLLKKDFNIDQIATYNNQQSALVEINKRESLQCIFIGQHIDNNNGRDFISSIKNEPKFRDTIVFLLAEDNSRESLLKAASSGANELISKPFSPRLLSLKLKRVFNDKIFRITKRVSLLGAINADIRFESGAHYTIQLLDVSLGGCSVRSPLLAHGGAVYDIAEISIHGDNSIQMPVELIRVEKDPETEDSDIKKLLLGFQIKGLKKEQKQELSDFISRLAEPGPKFNN